jgi:hypothetical protein
MDGRGTGLAIPLEHGRRLVLTEPGSSSATCCEARPPAAVSLRRPASDHVRRPPLRQANGINPGIGASWQPIPQVALVYEWLPQAEECSVRPDSRPSPAPDRCR